MKAINLYSDRFLLADCYVYALSFIFWTKKEVRRRRSFKCSIPFHNSRLGLIVVLIFAWELINIDHTTAALNQKRVQSELGIILGYPFSIHHPDSYCYCCVIAGCTSVNLERPIDCCISYDNSAAFLFGFMSSNPPINLEPFKILSRVQFGAWIA